MSLLLALLVTLGPTSEAAQPSASVGRWYRGSLEHGTALPAEGPHHYVVFQRPCYRRGGLATLYGDPSRRDNFFGHPSVIETIQRVASELAGKHPQAGRLPVGEISNATGGEIPRHLSHQNGLDVDVFFLQRSTKPHPVRLCRDGPSFEIQDPKTGEWSVPSSFDLALNWDLVAAFAKERQVQKILIGGLLRDRLKTWARANVERRTRLAVLRKLKAPFCRPPKGTSPPFYRGNFCPHDDHIHVRFHCPKDGSSPKCRG